MTVSRVPASDRHAVFASNLRSLSAAESPHKSADDRSHGRVRRPALRDLAASERYASARVQDACPGLRDRSTSVAASWRFRCRHRRSGELCGPIHRILRGAIHSGLFPIRTSATNLFARYLHHCPYLCVYLCVCDISLIGSVECCRIVRPSFKHLVILECSVKHRLSISIHEHCRLFHFHNNCLEFQLVSQLVGHIRSLW